MSFTDGLCGDRFLLCLLAEAEIIITIFLINIVILNIKHYGDEYSYTYR